MIEFQTSFPTKPGYHFPTRKDLPVVFEDAKVGLARIELVGYNVQVRVTLVDSTVLKYHLDLGKVAYLEPQWEAIVERYQYVRSMFFVGPDGEIQEESPKMTMDECSLVGFTLEARNSLQLTYQDLTPAPMVIEPAPETWETNLFMEAPKPPINLIDLAKEEACKVKEKFNPVTFWDDISMDAKILQAVKTDSHLSSLLSTSLPIPQRLLAIRRIKSLMERGMLLSTPFGYAHAR